MSTPASPDDTPSTKVAAARARRAILTLVLIVWIVFVATASYQWLKYAPPGDSPLAVRAGLALAFLAGPLWVLLLRIRGIANLRATSLPALVALALSSSVFLAWLAQDDANLRHADRHPALRNDFPEASATNALTLRYSQNSPNSVLYTLPETKLGFPPSEPGPQNDAKWTAFIAEHGPDIDTLWNQTAALRAWIDDLAAAPELGDLAEDFSSPIIGFRAPRLASQLASARALQLAAAGRRDEAAETMLPILVAGQKLEPHARTLVRRMIAVVLRKQAQNTLVRILDGGPLSGETRARLAAVLAPRDDTAEQARLLACAEYEILGPVILKMSPTQVATVEPYRAPTRERIASLLNPLFPLLYNPVRTANLAGDYFDQIGEALTRRDLATVANLTSSFSADAKGAAMPGKNHAGRLLLAMTIPSLDKVGESFWHAEDQRAALLSRLEKEAPQTAPITAP